MPNDIELEKVAHSVFGMTSRRYRQLAADGYAPPVEKGKIDFVSASKAIIEYYRKLAEGQGSLSLTDWRVELTKKKVEKEGVIVDKLKEAVILRKVAKATFGQLIVELKNAIRGQARRLAPVIAPISDPKEIEIIITRENDDILSRIGAEKKVLYAKRRPRRRSRIPKRVGRPSKAAAAHRHP